MNELDDLKKQIVRVKDNEDVPILVVGNKSDMEDERVITKEKGQEEVNKLGGNIKFMETSAKARIGVNEAFSELVRMVKKDLPPPEPIKAEKKEGCCILF